MQYYKVHGMSSKQIFERVLNTVDYVVVNLKVPFRRKTTLKDCDKGTNQTFCRGREDNIKQTQVKGIVR